MPPTDVWFLVLALAPVAPSGLWSVDDALPRIPSCKTAGYFRPAPETSSRNPHICGSGDAGIPNTAHPWDSSHERTGRVQEREGAAEWGKQERNHSFAHSGCLALLPSPLFRPYSCFRTSGSPWSTS